MLITLFVAYRLVGEMLDYNFYIETPRLVLSHLDAGQDAHCDFLVDLNINEHVPAKNGIGALVFDREAARKNIENEARIWTGGYGRYVVSLKIPPPELGTENDLPFVERAKAFTMIGVVTMKIARFKGAPLAPDVGYGILPAFRGKGYATEAAAALIEWFEKEKGQTEFFGFCDPNNEGSKGVLRRLGFEERGVSYLKGIKSDGEVIKGMVFTKGLKKTLEEHGISLMPCH